MTEASSAEQQAPPRRGFVRRVAYPAAVILAIAGVIYWLDHRAGGTTDIGEEYGPRDLPAALVPEGASVTAAVGSLAPDFLLENLDGGESRLSDYRGRPVVLNFWATWCRPCRKEMPQFVEAYDKYSADGLVIIGLNLQEGKSIIQPFADDYGIDFPVLIDRDGEVGDEYRLLGLPTTFFIDRSGVIRSIFRGPLEGAVDGTNVQGAIAGSDLDTRIAEILPEGDADGGG